MPGFLPEGHPTHHWHQRDTLLTCDTKGIQIKHQGQEQSESTKMCNMQPQIHVILLPTFWLPSSHEETIVMITQTNSTNVTRYGAEYFLILCLHWGGGGDVNALEY